MKGMFLPCSGLQLWYSAMALLMGCLSYTGKHCGWWFWCSIRGKELCCCLSSALLGKFQLSYHQPFIGKTPRFCVNDDTGTLAKPLKEVVAQCTTYIHNFYDPHQVLESFFFKTLGDLKLYMVLYLMSRIK
jgi:hypothetical protein